jgi:thioredoxin reductase (NADPH)
MDYPCDDLTAAAHRGKGVAPSGHGCQECLASGSEWVHLRLCLTCGHVGCCDDSPNKHATKHNRKVGHPVIRSFEPGEEWAYCYPHDAVAETFPAAHGESAPVHYDAP